MPGHCPAQRCTPDDQGRSIRGGSSNDPPTFSPMFPETPGSDVTPFRWDSSLMLVQDGFCINDKDSKCFESGWTSAATAHSPEHSAVLAPPDMQQRLEEIQTLLRSDSSPLDEILRAASLASQSDAHEVMRANRQQWGQHVPRPRRRISPPELLRRNTSRDSIGMSPFRNLQICSPAPGGCSNDLMSKPSGKKALTVRSTAPSITSDGWPCFGRHISNSRPTSAMVRRSIHLGSVGHREYPVLEASSRQGSGLRSNVAHATAPSVPRRTARVWLEQR